MLTYTPIAQNFEALEVKPDSSPRAGLILIQEIFGVNSNIQQLARQFASQGYHVIAPDLFWRTEKHLELDPENDADKARAMKLNYSFDDEQGIADLSACANYLRKKLDKGCKVFSVGYCLGGRLSFLLAKEKRVDAAVSYYGVNIDRHLDPPGKADVTPRLIHIPEKDSLCSTEAQQKIMSWTQQTATVETHIYPDAMHAFARENSPAFQTQAAALANQRSLQFLEKQAAI